MHRAAFPYLWVACLCLAGCAVAEHPYPIAWQPLVSQPDSDCREFQGRFADRGERNDEPTKPSLTRELFAVAHQVDLSAEIERHIAQSWPAMMSDRARRI